MNWKVKSSKYILKKPWMTVRADEVALPNGHIIPEYYVFEYPTWVNVIAIAEDGRFVLNRQYRHGIGRVCYEITAGVVEPTDASPLAGAKRELEEESGYGGGEWTELMQISGNPAACNNITHCYLARDVKPVSKPHLDAGEDLVCTLVEREKVRELLERGEFVQSLMAAPLWKFFASESATV